MSHCKRVPSPRGPCPARAGRPGGGPETRSGRVPARAGRSEPHFLRAGTGEARSISCCAAETSCIHTRAGGSAPGPKLSPFPRAERGARGAAGAGPGRTDSARPGPPRAAGSRSPAGAPRARPPPASLPVPARSPPEGTGARFQVLRGSTVLAQVS